MTSKKRRKPKLWERLTPCQCCGYPISQRHHLLDVAQYGESQYTRQLCANCHELYHVCEKAMNDLYYDKRKTRNVLTLNLFASDFDDGNKRIDYMVELILLVGRAKREIMEGQNKWASQAMEMFASGIFTEEESCNQ